MNSLFKLLDSGIKYSPPLWPDKKAGLALRSIEHLRPIPGCWRVFPAQTLWKAVIGQPSDDFFLNQRSLAYGLWARFGLQSHWIQPIELGGFSSVPVVRAFAEPQASRRGFTHSTPWQSGRALCPWLGREVRRSGNGGASDSGQVLAQSAWVGSFRPVVIVNCCPKPWYKGQGLEIIGVGIWYAVPGIVPGVTADT